MDRDGATVQGRTVAVYPLSDHPLRHVLNNELHARPPVGVRAPARVSHLAIHSGEGSVAEDHAGLVALCERYGVTAPQAGVNHFADDFGPFRLKWERHTEFVTYTFFAPASAADEPFRAPAIELVARDWLGQVSGRVLVAAHVAVIARDTPEPELAVLPRWLRADSIIGSLISGGAAVAFTDYRIHADGYSRIMIHDRGLSERQAGRLVQRLLEIDTYRMMALLALPVASEIAPEIARCERSFAEVTASMAVADGVDDERQLLDRLIALATSIERLSAATMYRFRAARAYHALVERRIEELREERLAGLQTVAEFMDRRLLPALRTCTSTAERLEGLSQRIARASELLRTRIDITVAEQNRDLLGSMDRRARLQLLLNETVEGLSVVVITYYSLGLLGYVLKALKPFHLPVDADLVTGAAFPVVLAVVWLFLRHMRKKLLTR